MNRILTTVTLTIACVLLLAACGQDEPETVIKEVPVEVIVEKEVVREVPVEVVVEKEVVREVQVPGETVVVTKEVVKEVPVEVVVTQEVVKGAKEVVDARSTRGQGGSGTLLAGGSAGPGGSAGCSKPARPVGDAGSRRPAGRPSVGHDLPGLPAVQVRVGG